MAWYALQALIKRHNVKMMNEMQEVVRQITTAKTRNEEVMGSNQGPLGSHKRWFGVDPTRL